MRGTVVERRSLAGELSLSCARLAADGWPLLQVNHLVKATEVTAGLAESNGSLPPSG